MSCFPSGTRGSVSYKVSISASSPSSLSVPGQRQRLCLTTRLAGLEENCSSPANLSHCHPGSTCTKMLDTFGPRPPETVRSKIVVVLFF